jgi:hypothetical protein
VAVKQILALRQRFLTWGPWIDCRGVREFEWEKNTALFSLNCNLNLVVHFIMNVSNIAVYGFKGPEYLLISVNIAICVLCI